MDEFAAIARFFAPLSAGEPGAFGLTDDAASLAPAPGCSFVVTADAMVAGVHFFADDPPEAIAAKLVRVNYSDLAAKGAVPRAVLLTVALPRQCDDRWLERFAQGLGDDLGQFGGTLVGGDTVSTPGSLTLSLTAIGEAPEGAMIRRAGARPGDRIAVSGTIGDAALYLVDRLAGRATDPQLERRYRYPEPRLALGRRLRGLAHAAADVSDGLIADLGHICTASAVAARIRAEQVPLSPAVAARLAGDPALVAQILGGGDDYELVVALPADGPVPDGLTVIGEVMAGQGVVVVGADGRPMPAVSGGWRHPIGGG